MPKVVQVSAKAAGGGGTKVSANSADDLTNGNADDSDTVQASESALKDLKSKTGAEYAEASKHLPDTIETQGPKVKPDNKEAGSRLAGHGDQVMAIADYLRWPPGAGEGSTPSPRAPAPLSRRSWRRGATSSRPSWPSSSGTSAGSPTRWRGGTTSASTSWFARRPSSRGWMPSSARWSGCSTSSGPAPAAPVRRAARCTPAGPSTAGSAGPT